MQENKIIENRAIASVSDDAGDAVGVPGSEQGVLRWAERRWYVAVVRHNTEKAVRERLGESGHEAYVASQTVERKWRNGRRAKVEKVLIPSLVFVRCTEKERRELVTLPYIRRFMTDKAGTARGGTKPLAVIPQREIDTLRFMLGQDDVAVTLVEAPYKVSDRVVVTRGSLRGLEGEVIQTIENRSDVIVRLDILGAARVTIDTGDIRPAEKS